MADISSNSKVAYMYDASANSGAGAWYAIAGVANTNVPYTWTQIHTFGSTVTVNDVIRAKGGVNRFQNPTARDSIITSPQKGTVCFVEQTDGGTDINQVQIYNGTSWVGMLDTTVFNNQTSNYTLVLGDAGKTILIDSTSDITVTVPSNASVPFAVGQKLDIIRMNTGNVTIDGTPEILSKDSSKEISSRYSRVTLIKKDTDTWILIGDLSEPVIPPFFPPFFPPTFTAPFFPPTFTSPFFPPTFGPFFAPAPFFPPTFTSPFFPPTFTPTPFFPPFFPPTFTSLQTYYFCCDDNTVGTVSAANSTDATSSAETFCFNISAALTGSVTTTPIVSCTQSPFFPPTFTPTPFFPPFFPPTFTSLQTYYFCCDDNTVGTTSAANSTDATNNAEAFCFSISAALTGAVTTSVITSCTQSPFFPPTFTSPFFPPTFTSPFFPPTFTSPFFPPTFSPTPYFPPPYFTPAWGGGGSPFFPPTFTASPFFPPTFTASPFFPPTFTAPSPFFPPTFTSPFFPPTFTASPFFPPTFTASPFFPPTFTAPAPYFPPPYFTPRWGSDYRLKNDIEEYQVDNSTKLISEIEVNDS